MIAFSNMPTHFRREKEFLTCGSPGAGSDETGSGPALGVQARSETEVCRMGSRLKSVEGLSATEQGLGLGDVELRYRATRE
jgi:hypothetical protein